MKIKHIIAREILDSRGTPTVSAEVILECGSRGEAIPHAAEQRSPGAPTIDPCAATAEARAP